MKNKELIIEKTNGVIEANCFPGLVDAAKDYLAAMGTQNEKPKAEYYVASLEQCILSVDQALGFCLSDKGKELFGAETAAKYAAHMTEIKEAGAKYCDCSKCSAAAAALELKDDILG